MNKSNLLIDYASPGNNSYGLVRLLAALAVIFSHAWIVVGGDVVMEPLEASTGYPIGAHAVHIFFILSGLMVTASFERSKTITAFIGARLLRIYPALIAVLVATIILGGLFYTSAAQSDYWSLGNVGTYFVRNMMLIGGGAALTGIFENNPIPHEINAPLWTLKYEVVCYISLVISLGLAHKLFPPEQRQKIILTIIGVILLAALVIRFNPPSYHDSNHFDHLVRMAFAFYLGCFAWIMRAKLVLSARITASLFLLAAFFTAFELPLKEQFQTIFVGYAVLWLGHFSTGKVQRFIDKQDYSYGVYIIGFPVQQSLIQFYGPMTTMENFMIAAALTLALAALSWNIVERPAMRLKKNFDPTLKAFLISFKKIRATALTRNG